jgi:phage shock protein C
MTTDTRTVKKFTLSRDDRMVFGVCGGIAQYLGVDAAIVRIAFVAGIFVGVSLPVYAAAWLLAPKADS